MASSKTLRIITALMLILALGEWPYAYYQLLRWLVCGTAVYVTYLCYENKRVTWAWLFGIVAVIFNPIAPIFLDRETWMLLDLTAAIIFVMSLFKGNFHSFNSETMETPNDNGRDLNTRKF